MGCQLHVLHYLEDAYLFISQLYRYFISIFLHESIDCFKLILLDAKKIYQYIRIQLIFIIVCKKQRLMNGSSSRKQIIKDEDQNYYMTQKNLQICNKNQDRYQTPELNDAFELHYYGFCNIANLEPYSNINTLYLNNNVIKKIQHLSHLKKLITLNLANNRITKIENLNQLTELFILDLSGNKIQKVEGINHLQKLTTLNISSNLIDKPSNISELIQNNSLTCLNLSSNPLPDEPELYNYLQGLNLLTLYIKETKFSRGIASYRKQTICRLKKLTYLDERPVTKDERMMAEAWKSGGLQAQKQARKLIQESKDEKNRKIYAQMTERSEKVQQLRNQLFEKLTHHEHLQLQELKKRFQEEKEKEKKDLFEIQLVQKKIQQISLFLQHFREDVNYMSVGEKPEVPNNLCQRHEVDAIYIYGVTEQQLPKIKQKYYPDETRPLIAVDFQSNQELRWIQNYDQILEQTCKKFVKKSEFILPVFNLKIHLFDYESRRNARRFREEQISSKIQKYTKVETLSKNQKEFEDDNQLNQLD